jgi:hypothetical protein
MTPPPISPEAALLWLLATFFVSLGLFLICRNIVLWYWKINRIVSLLESIDDSLKQLPAVANRRAVP